MLWVRRAHPPARRRPRRVPVRRRQPARRQGRARPPRPTRWWPSATRSTPTASPGRLTLITRMGAGPGRPRRCRRCCGPCARPATRWCGPAIPMHGNTFTAAERPQDPPLRRRAGRDQRVLRRPLPGRDAGRAASTSSSPATTSPSAWAAPRRSSTTDLGTSLRDHVRPPAQRPPVARPGLPGRRSAPSLDADPAEQLAPRPRTVQPRAAAARPARECGSRFISCLIRIGDSS